MKNHKIIVLIVLLMNAFINAQENDPLSLVFKTSPINNGAETIQYSSISANLLLPLNVREKRVIFGGFSYNGNYFSGFDLFPQQQLHRIETTVGLRYTLKNDNTLVLLTRLALASDFEDISGKDFRYLLGLRYTIKSSEDFYYGFGLAYAKQFFGNQIIPFLYVNWNINEKLKLHGQFPIDTRLQYQFNTKTKLGIKLKGGTESYRLSEELHNNQFVQIIHWDGGFYLEQKLFKKIKADIGLGYNLLRSFRLFEDSNQSAWTLFTRALGNEIEPLENLDDTNWFASFSLSYTIN
jgi:hypothetical protein